MPLFAGTGAQYDDQTAQQLSQEIQASPWRAEAVRRRSEIASRGGKWSPTDYTFFGLRPNTSEDWKTKYLQDSYINQAAASQTPTGRQTPGLSANYQFDDPSGNVTQRKSFVDTPLGKAAVLAPMIAGGGIAGASAPATAARRPGPRPARAPRPRRAAARGAAGSA